MLDKLITLFQWISQFVISNSKRFILIESERSERFYSNLQLFKIKDKSKSKEERETRNTKRKGSGHRVKKRQKTTTFAEASVVKERKKLKVNLKRHLGFGVFMILSKSVRYR